MSTSLFERLPGSKIMSKWYRCAAIFVFLALTLTYPTKTLLADGNEDTTRQVILAMFAAFNEHDIEAIVDLYSDDAQIFSPGDSEIRIGQAVVREIYANHFADIPNVHDEVRNIVIDGDQGAVEFIATWDQPSDSHPDARGKLRIAAFLIVQNGKIVKDIAYFDRQEFSNNMTVEAELQFDK